MSDPAAEVPAAALPSAAPVDVFDWQLAALRMPEVVADLEDKFKLRIPDEALRDVDTVADVAKAMALGADAVAMAHATPIDLLLTDVVMPELSGRQVADEVRMLQPEVGVLFMSGFSEGTTGSPVDSVADLDLVQKPFSERTLLERVRGALTTHR